MVTNMISQLQKSFPLRRAVGSFEIKKKSCVAMVTNMISQLQKSFPLRRAVGSFEIKKKLSFM